MPANYSKSGIYYQTRINGDKFAFTGRESVKTFSTLNTYLVGLKTLFEVYKYADEESRLRVQLSIKELAFNCINRSKLLIMELEQIQETDKAEKSKELEIIVNKIKYLINSISVIIDTEVYNHALELLNFPKK